MFKINKNILFVSGAIIVLIVIIAANFIFKSDTRPVQINNSNNTDNPQNTSDISGQNIINREVPPYSGRPINEVKFGAGFSAPQSAIAQKTKDLSILKTALEKDPFNINDWITVGITKKFFNDYEGARDAWEYAAILYPNDPLAFENLGNLYSLYLRDNAKAEYNYKKAVENNPIEPGFYIALADFYKTFLSDNSKAIGIILSGMEKIKDINLFLNLAGLYRDMGDKTNAIKYYQEVLKISPDHPGIQEEIDHLK